MSFYSIQNSLNRKVLGSYPQVKNIHYNCDVWDEPNFIEHIHNRKIDFKPIIANAILKPKSIHTDLISTLSAIGFSGKLLVSEKLKKILEKNRKTGLQFFRSPLIQHNNFIMDYWILNMFEFNNEYIDTSKSVIIHNKKSNDYKTSFITVKNKVSYDNFQLFEDDYTEKWTNNEELILIEKLNLNTDNILENFFQLKYGTKYVVSEKLKKEIEDEGCTGIEFQPVELSLNEWLMPGGAREKIYGKS